MICQNCHKRIANVHLTQVINDSKVELHLCEQCAGEKSGFGYGAPLGISNFITGLLGLSGTGRDMAAEPSAATVARCDKCGMSMSDFQQSGKMGCGECYRAFSDIVRNLLKRIHGNASHTGRMPVRLSATVMTDREIEKLKESLSEAIRNEEYEKAAELRDRIKGLEAT